MKKINLSSKSAFKILAGMFICSLIFTLFSSSILRITAIPGALRNRAAAIAAQQSATANNNNNNNFVQDIIQNIVPDTTVANIDVAGTTAPQTTAPTTAAPTTTEKAPETTASGGSSSEPETTTTTTAPTTTEPLTDSPQMIKEKKATLDAYKKVVNANKTLKPGFTKIQYRTIETNKSFGGVLGDMAKNYPGYFISQESAEAAPQVVPNLSDMSLFLTGNDFSACNLAAGDASEAIRSVKKEAQSDGSNKITIVLRDEENPAVTPTDAKKPESFTSAVFPVVDKEDMKTKITNRVSGLYEVSDVNLKYHDCTMEIVYMPKTGKIVSVTQIAKYDMTVTYSALFGLIPGEEVATVTDTAIYTNFVY